jgi:hypothetical protein
MEGNSPDELEAIMALGLEYFPISDINFVFNL